MSLRLPSAVQPTGFRCRVTPKPVLLPAASCSRPFVTSRIPETRRASLADRQRTVVARAAAADTSTPVPSTANGKLISTTEIAAFIQRDDLMDQMYRWALIEAGEGGFRNFGMPMTVQPFYSQDVLWGYTVGIYKDGSKQTDLAIMFDEANTTKSEWIGRGDDGFPVAEGRQTDVLGKNFMIWKLDSTPVSEELRSTIRAFCTGLVAALNRYYAFGSVFVDDAQ